jgi:hypothetical protein
LPSRSLEAGPDGDLKNYVASLALADADERVKTGCSRCGGIGVHDALESVFTMGWRTQ